MASTIRGVLVILALMSLALAQAAQAASQFASASDGHFVLGGQPLRFSGTNNYYLHYKSRAAINDVLQTAADQGLLTVRAWAFIDIGHADGSGSVDSGGGAKEGYFMQYFDSAANQPAFHEAGFAQLDYAVSRAAELGLKMVLVLTNNWQAFGGVDQYVRWRQWAAAANASLPAIAGDHDDFYSDPLIRVWYQNWARHVMERVNTVSGVRYKDDPAVFSWELVNEPRCQGSGNGFGTSDQCVLNYAKYDQDPVAKKIGDWVHAMAAFVKSIDSNHLFGVGDEGFTCQRYQVCSQAECSCYYGVDSDRFSADANIDYMSLHLYPSTWGKTVEWGSEYLANHSAAARSIGKPVFLGEYGMPGDQPTPPQHLVYSAWGALAFDSGMNADAYWILSGKMDDGSWYGNYDGFGVYCPRAGETPPNNADPESCGVLADHAKRMRQS